MSSWKILSSNELDANRWDDCVSESEDEHIYGYSWYLNAVSPSWKGCVLGDYQAVFALPVKSKYGVPYIYQPQFYQRSTLFGIYQESAVKALWKLIQNHYLKIDLTSIPSLDQSAKPLSNLILPAGLKAKYSKNCTRNIKRSLEAGVSLHAVEKADGQLILAHFVANTRFSLHADFQSTFNRVHAVLQSNQALQIFEAKQHDEVLAYACCAKSKSRLVLLMLSADEKAKQIGASHALIDAAIQFAQSNGLIFDFEGSQHAGIRRFYAGFGAVEESYFHIQSNLRQSLKTRLLKKP